MTNNNPDSDGESWVTFCMSTYKRPDFLRKQIRTILNQTFQNFSIIISDNDTEASAKRIVEDYNDPRIQYFVNESNLGMVRSFNRSLEKAKSEYVVMITDDDPLYPDMLQRLHDLSAEYPDYGIYYGGCDIQCNDPIVAKSSRLRVGTNSCLANLPIDTVRVYQGNEFPFAYFTGRLGCHLLWSTGIVRREIALEIGGMPDFGSPYNTDFGYMVLSGSYSGAVLLNTSLGCQVVHGANYGYTESDFEKFYITPDAFTSWVMDRLSKNFDFSGLRKEVETFVARWAVEYAVSIKKFLRDKNIRDSNFDKYVSKLFKVSYMRKWKWKYKIAIHFPHLFVLLIELKKRFFNNNSMQ
jgi:glycosyltransferase involved in cell wall biosynthesis